jgi:glucosamine--fructose-6-phosphate aminotransferase (isomerizing)
MNKFLKEILEQPAAIENGLSFYTSSEGLELLGRVKKTISDNKIDQIIFTGMGSSYFTSYAASCLFNELKIHSFVINASELLHYNLSLFDKETLLVCSSQSGESFEIQEITKKLPERVHCVGIIKDRKSVV